jgi:hypothetical protein
MRKNILAVVLFLISNFCFAQDDLKFLRNDTDLLSKEFHKGRRDAVRSKMPDKSVAVFFASPERSEMQRSPIYGLCGERAGLMWWCSLTKGCPS